MGRMLTSPNPTAPISSDSINVTSNTFPSNLEMVAAAILKEQMEVHTS
jgi:hypothetical protein